MASFEAAATQGADGVELDVRRSSDGALVVIHDRTLERTTDSSGAVSAHDCAELGRTDAGWSFTDAAGGHPFRGRGVTVPLLDEVLDWARGAGMVVNVEVKVDEADPGLSVDVARVVAARGDADTVFLSTFSLEQAAAAAAAVPEVAVAQLSRGWAPLDALAAAAAAGCRGVHPDLISLSEAGAERVVEAAAAKRCWVGTWTVNQPADVERLGRSGIAALITDDPAGARSALG